jgi:hypothetical protein
MSRRKQHKERLPPFIPITHQQLESAAFKALSGNAAKLYPYFIRACVRCCKGKPDTTTQFDFTYGEAVKLGFARNTFSRCLKELNQNGFIDWVEVGGLRGVGHSNSKYRLSDRWALWGGIGWAQQSQKGTKK